METTEKKGPTPAEARELAAKTAKRRRLRVFLTGALAGIAACVLVVAAIASVPEPPPNPWTAVGTSQPATWEIVLVAKADGDWASAYMDDAGEFKSPCDGARLRGVVRWMRIPERP